MNSKPCPTQEVNIRMEGMSCGGILELLCLVSRTPGCPPMRTPEGLHSSLIDRLWFLIMSLTLVRLAAATCLLICVVPVFSMTLRVLSKTLGLRYRTEIAFVSSRRSLGSLRLTQHFLKSCLCGVLVTSAPDPIPLGRKGAEAQLRVVWLFCSRPDPSLFHIMFDCAVVCVCV